MGERPSANDLEEEGASREAVKKKRSGGDAFPVTPASAVIGVRSTNPVERARSHTVLAKRYWKATYKYIRLRWSKPAATAEEITQEFFLRALDKNTFLGYDARQARFRTFVRVCIDRFVVDQERHTQAKKRGGGTFFLQLDFKSAEDELGSEVLGVVDPEALFETEWVKSLLESAVGTLHAVCIREKKEQHFRAFELFHLSEDSERPSYEDIAQELGISVRDVNNRLTYARREFRAAVLEALRECTGSEQEMQDEARVVLGIDF
ncbi:MAG TPA: sigma-70 family RNA polymerase sigma factor [Polyangiaceae bacterium]|nr:sigma-70 family RNA polymerase sigma factor [Polyangiaceae bacterium]